ncbi:MAG: GAF domain-containing protein [Thermomicrobiales bacterium]
MEISLGLQVRPASNLPEGLANRIRRALDEQAEIVVGVRYGEDRYVFASLDNAGSEGIVAGPYRTVDDDADRDLPHLTSDAEERVRSTLSVASEGLRGMAYEPRQRLELSRQMEMLSSAVVAISGELQLEAVLRRITDLARNFAAAKYAALGIPDQQGRMQTFITAGISEAQQAMIDHRPEGLGLLGLLLKQERPIRLKDLKTHPASSGFPANHPAMSSFLGVPIISRGGEIIGSLYLAEKRFEAEFSLEDEMLIDLLARHAAVAIENARLYRRLEEQEQRLNVILDQLPEAVMITEPDPPRLVILNQQARRLLEIDEPVPVPIAYLDDVLEIEDESGAEISVEQTPPIRSLVLGETVIREEVTSVVASGRRRTFLVNSTPMYMDGEIGGSICVFQDITEIRDADRIKDDFLSLVSHELRTPLTTIHGGAQLLQQQADVLDRETRDELLHDINQESARLATLIQNMVQLTHIRAGRIALEPEPILLRMLVERCVRQLRPLDPTRDFRIDVESDSVAMADPDRFDEMLRNVIHNALKYTPAGTQIDIVGRSDDGHVELAVRDYGPGIPEHEVRNVFDRFERGSRAAADSSGMGLGLYLVRLLVEAQNGHVTIELPEDGGTRVLFSLPQAAADA